MFQKPYPQLDWCMSHGYQECDCLAIMVALGCSDLNEEARLEFEEEERMNRVAESRMDWERG